MRRRIFFIVTFILLAVSWYTAPRAVAFLGTTARSVVSLCLYPFMVVHTYAMQPLALYVNRSGIKRDYARTLEQYQAEQRALLARYITSEARRVELEHEIPYVADTHPYPALPARVIYRDLAPEQQLLVVDKGSLHGVECDMIAVEHNCLVGRVVEVYPWYAKILLITHEHCKVPALCAQSRAHGVHQGAGSSEQTSLHFVSHLEALEQGELVLSSGDGLVFPAGYALGSILTFEVNELGYLYEVVVQPLLDVRSITHCSLLSKGTRDADRTRA